MKAKEFFRWAAVLSFGGFGLYNLTECGRVLFRSFTDGDWGWGIFTIYFTGLMAGVPLAISYFAFRREYRHVVIVVAVVAAFFVFGALMSLPSRLGNRDFLLRQGNEMPGFIISLPLCLLWLFGPYYAAAWFLRLTLRLADRYIFHESPKERIA
jgi:hypothetical protein